MRTETTPTTIQGTPDEKQITKPKKVEKFVPVVPVWKAISHNPLILAIRFHGVIKALRKEVDVGPLKMQGLEKARMKLSGTRKIDGETLPVVTIKYPQQGAADGSALVELGEIRARIKDLSLRFTVRVPKRVKHKLVFAYVDPGKLLLDVDTVTGREITSFTDPIPFSIDTAKVTNTVAVAVKRSKPTSPVWTTGALRMDAKNLDFKQVAFSFGGENNVLNLSGNVQMPNDITWAYDFWNREMIWKSGELVIGNLSLQTVPVHPIDFGGAAITLNAIGIDEARITKKEFPSDALPVAKLTGLKIDATDLDYKHSTLTGTLTAPITIKQIDAEISVKNIFEGISFSRQRLQDMHIGLAGINFQGENGLSVQGQTLDINVPKYRSDEVPGSTPDTSASAHILLQNFSVPQLDGGSANIAQLSADLQGPTDKLNGRGTLNATVTNVNTTVSVDVSKIFPDCANHLVPLRVVQHGTTPPITANVDIFNGEPRGIATVEHLEFTLEPQDWSCEYNSGSIGFTLPGIYFAIDWNSFPPHIDGPRLTPDGGPRIDLGQIHWKAVFNKPPTGGAAGELYRGELRFDKDGVKICGGHTLVVGLLWLPTVFPTFNDCSSDFCKIPRNLVQDLFTVSEAPMGILLNAAALSVVDAVGLFDVGLFDSKCRT